MEHHLTPHIFLSPAAKLGDTKELEDFIADLDRTLESECWSLSEPVWLSRPAPRRLPLFGISMGVQLRVSYANDRSRSTTGGATLCFPRHNDVSGLWRALDMLCRHLGLHQTQTWGRLSPCHPTVKNSSASVVKLAGSSDNSSFLDLFLLLFAHVTPPCIPKLIKLWPSNIRFKNFVFSLINYK